MPTKWKHRGTTAGTNRARRRPADWIPVMTERIVRQFQPLRVVLFGSYARGEADRHSDVDLLVVLPRVADQWQASRAIGEVLHDIPVPIDIIVTTPDEIARWGNFVGMVLRPALRDGRVLYDSEGESQSWQPGAIGKLSLAGEEYPVDENDRLAATRRWFRQASADLRAAEAAVSNPEMEPNHACFLAQQAAEKAVKTVLVYLQLDFPFTHGLDTLRNLVPEGWRIKEERLQLYDLSRWAVQARYPGDWPDPTEADAREAVRQARAVYEAVLHDLEHHGFDPAGSETQL